MSTSSLGKLGKETQTTPLLDLNNIPYVKTEVFDTIVGEKSKILDYYAFNDEKNLLIKTPTIENLYKGIENSLQKITEYTDTKYKNIKPNDAAGALSLTNNRMNYFTKSYLPLVIDNFSIIPLGSKGFYVHINGLYTSFLKTQEEIGPVPKDFLNLSKVLCSQPAMSPYTSLRSYHIGSKFF